MDLHFLRAARERMTALQRRALLCTTVAIAFAAVSGALIFSGSFRALAIRSLLATVNTLPPYDENGRTNILLLGVGDEWHEAGNLTDTIMIASVDPKRRSIVLLSIPRDLELVDENEYSLGRINELYSTYKSGLMRQRKISGTGASLLALQATATDIGRRIGISLHGTVKVNFSGFIDVIDAVGGVDVDVAKTLVDYGYPIEEGIVGTLTIEKGMQHMDGKTALRYARSRHTTSDFDRSDRQQQLLSALLDKVKSLKAIRNPDAIRALLKSLHANFESTLTARELLGLGGIALATSTDRMLRMNLNYEAGGEFIDASAGGFVAPTTDALSLSESASGAIIAATLLPVSVSGKPSDWGQLRSFASLIFLHREVLLGHSEIILEPHGAKNAQVQKLKNELLRYGFNAKVQKPDNLSDTRDSSELRTLHSGSAERFLAKLLALPVLHLVETPASDAEIRIILGKDFTYVPFQTLLERI